MIDINKIFSCCPYLIVENITSPLLTFDVVQSRESSLCKLVCTAEENTVRRWICRRGEKRVRSTRYKKDCSLLTEQSPHDQASSPSSFSSSSSFPPLCSPLLNTLPPFPPFFLLCQSPCLFFPFFSKLLLSHLRGKQVRAAESTRPRAKNRIIQF